MGLLEKFFFNWGTTVSTYPRTTILLSLCSISVILIGILLLDFEVRNKQ